MTRTGDLAVPTLPPPSHTPAGPVAQRLHIALEQLPDAAYTWDDEDPAVVWEDAAPAPAADLFEPFDNYTANGWVLNSTPTIVAGRTGTAANITGSSQFVTYNIAAPLRSDWATIGFAFRVTDADPKVRDIFRLKGDTGTVSHTRVTLTNSTGVLTYQRSGTVLGASAAGAVPQNVWVYIEVQVKVADAPNGAVIVRVNGADVLNLTGVDTREPSTNTTLDQVLLGAATSAVTHQYDDLYLTMGAGGTFLGPITIPPAAGLMAYPTPYVWDAPFIGGGMTDAVCDFMALEILTGHPDEDSLFPAAECVLTVDNRSGEYSTLDAGGRLVYAAVGRRVQIWADVDGAGWWLFAGRVTSWVENPDDTVTVTAHDGFAQLARDAGLSWTPGTADQTAAARIQSILAAWSYTDPVSLAVTDVRMGAPPTERSPLEECQVTALSDGGVLWCEPDSRLWYRGRDHLAGRTDQTTVRTFSDNVCDATLVVWDLEVVSSDDAVATTVRLENWETPPKTSSASQSPSPPFDVPYLYTHPERDLWSYQADGDRLAADLVARLSNGAARFGWTLHLLDPHQDLWRAGIDLRLFDRLDVVRTYPAAGGAQGWLDVTVLCVGIDHEITPEAWLVTVETGRVTTYRVPYLWDRSPYTWDQDVPGQNEWSR